MTSSPSSRTAFRGATSVAPQDSEDCQLLLQLLIFLAALLHQQADGRWGGCRDEAKFITFSVGIAAKRRLPQQRPRNLGNAEQHQAIRGGRHLLLHHRG